MVGRDPREARMLGLWTAGWLAVLLLAGLLWVGDLRLEWPVLLVPLAWALVALRPRPGRRNVQEPEARERWHTRPGCRPGLGHRTDTVERPAVWHQADRDDWDSRWP